MLVIENPASSSPGLAFLLLTVNHFGDPGYLDYWKQLRENGVVIVDGWETAYYTNFSGSSGHGPQSMVVSYATSPAAEVIFAESARTDAPTASIIGPDTCFRQIEFVGILKGTQHADLARRFVDFMLAPVFQADIPLQMFVYPVRPEVEMPEAFTLYAQVPSEPAILTRRRDRRASRSLDPGLDRSDAPLMRSPAASTDAVFSGQRAAAPRFGGTSRTLAAPACLPGVFLLPSTRADFAIWSECQLAYSGQSPARGGRSGLHFLSGGPLNTPHVGGRPAGRRPLRALLLSGKGAAASPYGSSIHASHGRGSSWVQRPARDLEAGSISR